MEDTNVTFFVMLYGLILYGPLIAIVIFLIRKIAKKIKDKKRQKLWKASAEAAARQEAEEAGKSE